MTTATPSPSLFISYRRDQLHAVEPVYVALRAAGIDCFLDRDAIAQLEDFPARLRAGIDGAHAVLVWWSLDYTDSEFCMAELRLAFQHARRLSSDVGRRIWVLNTESGAAHIFAGELDRQNYLDRPRAGGEHEWATHVVLPRLRALLAEGTLASERSSQRAPKSFGRPARSRRFTGRSLSQLRIHAELHPAELGAKGASKGVHVHGMAGVGKSEFATAYADDFASSYPGGIFWLNFASWRPPVAANLGDAQVAWLEALKQALEWRPALARALTRDKAGAERTPASVHERLTRLLDKRGPYLWVLDNIPALKPADERERIVSFLKAPTSGGRTLLTSRFAGETGIFPQERLDPLDVIEAGRLLARYRSASSSAETNAISRLVELTGGHTLALVLLGEQARFAEGGFVRVLQQLQNAGALSGLSHVAAALEEDLGKSRALNVATTIALSIEPLSDDAKHVLSRASVCAPNQPIPDQLLAGSANGVDALAFASALRELVTHSVLLRRTDDGGATAIHPLTAATAVEMLAERIPAARQRVTLTLLATVKHLHELTAHRVYEREIAHAHNVTREHSPIFASHLLRELAKFHLARGEARLAIASGAMAVAYDHRDSVGDEKFVLGSMYDLAQIFARTGDLQSAKRTLEHVVAQSEKCREPDAPETLQALEALAIISWHCNEPPRARTLMWRVLDARRRAHGNEHPETLRTMGLLATFTGGSV